MNLKQTSLKRVLYAAAGVGLFSIPLIGGCLLGQKGPVPGSLVQRQNGRIVSFELVGGARIYYELDHKAYRMYSNLLVTQNPSFSYLAALLGFADKNHDGKITESELECVLRREQPYTPRDGMLRNAAKPELPPLTIGRALLGR